MRRADWGWGLAAGLALGVAGFGLRGAGVGWPVEGLFAQITFWLGVPAVFNLVHRVLGDGDLAKNLAFAGSALLWLLLHPLALAGLRRWFWPSLLAAFGFYGAFGGWALGMGAAGWLAAAAYTAALAGLAWWLRGRGRTGAQNPARREGLKTLGVLALGALLWQQAQAQLGVAWDKIAGLSPEQTPQSDLYTVSKNPSFLDPKLDGRGYRLEVSGLVASPLSLSLDQLKALPAAELSNVMICISNEVGGELVGSPRWRGVRLAEVLRRAGVRPEAKWLVWEAADRMVESIPVAEVPPEALLAYAIHNPATGAWEDLEAQHGYPTRILLPGRYGMKQPKWLTKISLSATEAPGYWAQRGWSRTAVVRTMSRIDAPVGGGPIPAGQETVIAGVAYAGGRPLERVEVSTDGGKTWQKAQLKPPRGKYAWQLWALAWTPKPGTHDLRVRAVEVGEKAQDEARRPPLPDGATGHHTVRVRAV